MTLTTAERITVDGVDLKTYAKNIETLAATLRVAPRRGENLALPGRIGRLRQVRKPHDQNTLVWPMWVVGCTDDGTIPTTKRTEFYKRIDELTKLFSKDGAIGLLDVRHTLPDTTVRQCLAEVTDVIDFSTAGWGDPIGKFSVALVIPDVYFRDVNTTNASATAGSTLPKTLTPSGFAAATAPCTDGVYTVAGPITNPRITDVVTGAYVQYNGTVANGTSWVVDAGAFTSMIGANSVMANTAHVGPMRGLLVMHPNNVSGGYSIQLSGSGGGTNTNISVTARNKYLVG